MLTAWEEEYDIAFSPSIHFTGGEPFVFQGLWEVIAHARRCGFQVAILTNGTLVKAEDAVKASQLGITDVQVSLEGPPSIHDEIRGAGSYATAIEGARLLIEAGNNVSASMTLSSLNANSLEETVRTAKAVGFSGIGFSRLVPCGSGQDLLEYMLSPSEIGIAYGKALRLNSRSFAVSSGDPLYGVFSGVKPPPQSDLTLSGCSAGFSGVTITSDGSVMPCRRIGIKIGNLKKKTLRQIWSSSKLLWKLRQRDSYRGKCGRCHLWPACRGCRAVAYAYSKSCGAADLFADDPQCWMARPDR